MASTRCQGGRPNDGNWRLVTRSTDQTRESDADAERDDQLSLHAVQLSAFLLCSVPLHPIPEMTSAVISPSPETKGAPQACPFHHMT